MVAPASLGPRAVNAPVDDAIAVYLHIPFCRTKCPYCDFVSQAVPGGVADTFVDALCREITTFEGPSRVLSVFFGGGTPSLLGPAQIARVLDALATRFTLLEPEISIEANPDDVAPDLAAAWKDLGVTRVSLGVQSFNDEALIYLGRRHDAAGARKACDAIAARFVNWSMDLILGAYPVAAWEKTVEEALVFFPPHLSAYGLTYETGTPFEERQADAIDDDTWLGLYRHTDVTLFEAGYRHYEISSFARPGFACRHNMVYWRNEEYAGFGPAAYSFIGRIRACNTASLDGYLRQPGRKDEVFDLTGAEIRAETVLQHLRLRDGVSARMYRQRFKRNLRDDFGPALERLRARGLLEEHGGVYRPTALGFELNNEIGLALLGG